MTTPREERVARLREGVAAVELDGLVVSAPADVFYLSGFRGSSGVLLIAPGRAMLFSDFRYRLQAAQQAPGFEFVEVKRRLLGTLGEVAKANGVRRLGFDPTHLTCAQNEELATGAEGVDLSPAAGLVGALRAVKSPEEVDCIRAAAQLADQALSHLVTLLQPGARERDIALAAEFVMRRAGAEAAAFDLIIASGPNSALPHAETTDRELQPGDLVVVDIGARLHGYCSDMTRTYAVCEAPPRLRDIYRLVYQAQRQAAAAVRPGAVCGELDRMARTLIEEAGYGDCFGHGLGHGVGLEVHEAPRLRKDEQAELVPGNVITVEPAIYLPEIGGVRLEDLLVVTQNGADVLTGSPMPSELPVI
jgi:Xaa-Pro aminopeptidase